MKHKFLPTCIIAWISLILLTSCNPAGIGGSTTLASPSSSPTVFWAVGDLGWGDEVTPMICCTPPACTANEAYYCPGECPCGCGTTCATITATPTPLFFVCVECEFGSALESICPLASAEETIRELLIPYGDVQSALVSGHACLYVSTFDGSWGYLYYVDEATSTVEFVVINPNLLIPSPTLDLNSPTPYTHLPDFTEIPTWSPTPS